MLKEFREFATRGNAIDLAIGLVLGSAFLGVVTTVVNGILVPPIGLLFGGGAPTLPNLFVVLKPGSVPPPYATLLAAQEARAVTLNYGQLVTAIITFLIVAFSLFLMVKALNRLHKPGGARKKGVRFSDIGGETRKPSVRYNLGESNCGREYCYGWQRFVNDWTYENTQD